MTSGRGQSEPIGVILLLSLVILGTTAVVALGSTALTNTRDQSQIARAEQSLTLFDSQAAEVALGDSAVQTVDFGASDGTFSVRENAGSISIVQLDCDDDNVDDDGDDIVDTSQSDEDDAYILPKTDLGAVVYESGATTLAYQGGGVWRTNEGAGSVMVSPPEFHYRGATLTLPLVLTRGSGGGSGSVSATVSSSTNAIPVFPDSAQQFPARCEETGDDEPFGNPITDGTVIVRIESEYAQAWGKYFDARTSGDVRYPSPNEVVVELISIGQLGTFGMPGDGGSVTVAGTSGGHSTKEFTITLRPDGSDNAKFDNLQWSMYVEESGKRLEIYLKRGSGSDTDCSDGTTDLHADLDIYYSPDGGDTYYGWHRDDAYAAQCKDYDDDPDEEIYLTADFVDDEDGDATSGDSTYQMWTDVESGDPQLTYVDKDSMNNLVHFGISGSDTAPSSYTMDGHGGWESETYAKDGDTETVDRLVNHYFGEMPAEFQLVVDDKGSNTVSESESSGTIRTGGTARYVTFLHVTRNEIEVEVN